jgi:AcrR family transcriptional regulator
MMAQSTTLTPREKRSLKTRTAILDAAINIINAEGIKELSIRRIAREIDYSPAALYEYFKSKEDILDALCQLVDARLATYLELAPTTPPLTGAQKIIEIGMNYLQFARENAREYSILFQGSNVQPGETTIYGSAFVILLDAVNVFLSSKPQSEKSGESMNAEAFAYSCWAFVHGMATLSIQVESMTAQSLDIVHRAALTRFINSGTYQ